MRVCSVEDFGDSLACSSQGPMKCVPLNNQKCQVRPTLVDINFDKTVFYQFAISVNKCGGS